MAFSDYDQSQIVSQIQAYFRVKHAAYTDFLPNIDPDNISGDPADPNSTLHQALEALRGELHGDNIDPADPQYLEKVYNLASRDLSNDQNVESVLNLMQEAQQRGPDALRERSERIALEKQRLEQQNQYGREQIAHIAEQVEAESRAADDDAPGNYRNTNEIQYNIGVNVMKMQRIDAETFQIAQIQEFQSEEQRQTLLAAQTMVAEGEEPDAPEAPKQDAPAAPPPPPDDSSIYFINMIALNNPGFSTHSQRVWDMMKSEQLPAGEAIDRYLDEFVRNYAAENRGEQFPQNQAVQIQQQLIGEISHLQNLESSIQGISMTPEDIADHYIEHRVMPSLHEGTAGIIAAMKENGGDFDEAVNDYLSTHNIRGDERTALRERIENEVLAVNEIRDGIIAYEGMSITPDDAERIMRQSWETADLPKPADHYAEMLQEKIAHYQSAAGGDLDVQTASARAAVDVRAQIDDDRGVPQHMIVNENHTFYQNDIMQMEGWMRNQMLIEQEGGVSPEEAAAHGVEGRDLSNTSALDFYSREYGGSYAIHRRGNLEQTFAEVYQEQKDNPRPAPQHAVPEVRAEPEPQPQSLEERDAFQVITEAQSHLINLYLPGEDASGNVPVFIEPRFGLTATIGLVDQVPEILTEGDTPGALNEMDGLISDALSYIEENRAQINENIADPERRSALLNEMDRIETALTQSRSEIETLAAEQNVELTRLQPGSTEQEASNVNPETRNTAQPGIGFSFT